MSDKIADVGKAENQSMPAWSVIELQREVSKLGAENARLKEMVAAQQRQLRIATQDAETHRENAEMLKRESGRRGLVIERYEGEIRSIAGNIEVMGFDELIPEEYRFGRPLLHTQESVFNRIRALAASTIVGYGTAIPPPRQQEQEAQPVPVHPPCRVTHSGGE